MATTSSLTAAKRTRVGVGQPAGGEFMVEQKNDGTVVLVNPEPEFDEPEDDGMHGRRFTIPDTRLDKAIASIEKANRRLAKLGIDDKFTYELEDGVRTVNGQNRAIVTLTLNRPAISYDGWSFTGAHDFTPDGSVISHGSGPNTAVVEDAHCDHCEKNRRRERVYTLHSETEGDKQVGKSCLHAFLGVKPEGLWALDADLGLDDPDPEDENGYSVYGQGSQLFPAEDLLAVAIEASKGGEEFVSKQRQSHENPATADVILGAWDKHFALVTDDHRKLASEIREWVSGLDADDNDYLLNLKAVLAGGDDNGEKWVKKKHVALATSAIGAYQYEKSKKLVKEVQADARDSFKPGFIGDVDEKVKGVPATVLRSHVIEGASYTYNTTSYKTIVTMISDDGHQVTWFASGSKSFKVGQKVLAAGRVKDHGTYDGADQTVIWRAKLTDPETGAKLGDEDED